MNFQRGRGFDEPEINLIPFIDVLLVIIIFLMLTTTYAKFSGLEIDLPTAADASRPTEPPNEVEVAVSASGKVLVDGTPLAATDVRSIGEALRRAAGDRQDPLIVISADAKATHQSVIDVMQAAQSAGYPHISFATQTPPP
ncbi:MAG: biopolymer transporter ExbD [Candidatus Accumulibacter sp.]|jgi:biopolymer transport protein ExbD|nr:biopolymer transporter ExbD [Accumulibacter sp.]